MREDLWVQVPQAPLLEHEHDRLSRRKMIFFSRKKKIFLRRKKIFFLRKKTGFPGGPGEPRGGPRGAQGPPYQPKFLTL